MSWALPLPVAIPLLTAAVIVAGDRVLPRRVEDALGILAAAAACAFSLLVLTATEQHDLVHWFGGWRPRGGVAIGVSFVADPLGAGMAALASGLTLLALVFSWTYLREAARLFDVLMLVICAGMCGFALTGDLFNMFVFFELTAVAAYALTGFKVRELGPIQGGVNFAISNTVGAYMILVGIALLYGRTGALNLAQIGHALTGAKPDGLLVVALTLVFVGFLVKAAIVPFHLWLADAYAVAPIPVCMLFAGVMSDLGLFAIARIYWTVFDGPFASHQAAIRSVLLALGIVTALLAAVMTFMQRHLKRMLAYATISDLGAMLVGVALLDSKSLAGTATFVLAHALLKGGLFLACGILARQLHTVDELRLRGRGRELPVVGVLFGLGAVGLIGLPYVGTFLGHELIGDAASLGGRGWIPPLLALAASVSSAAILRAGARVFLGWGPAHDPLLTREPPERDLERKGSIPFMVAVTATAIVLGLAVSVVPGLERRAELGADRFRDRAAYAALVLRARTAPAPPRPSFSVPAPTAESVLYGIGSGLAAFLLAAFGLWRSRLPRGWLRVTARAVYPPLDGLRDLHSGVVGDYVVWIVVGTAVVGGIWTLTLR
jgi:multicomponent Na+:H+ antiporter subunit D